jgi:exopolyphosphatase/guanosine-5'-triphosphate,3'-diphosphate pyrophosphatase
MAEPNAISYNRKHAACIDVGTNSVKILIASMSQDETKPVFELSATTRLGEGLTAVNHMLLELPMRRTLEALATLKQAASNYQLEGIACVGTAALRDAVNSGDFIKRARETLGLDIEIISGDEEARLSFLAVRCDLNWRSRPRLRVIDVGGGSTEIILGLSNTHRIESRYSVNLGAVKLTERYLTSDPPTVDQLAAASSALQAEFARIALHRTAAEPSDPPVVGVGGTLTTLAAMCIGGVKDPLKIHGYTLSVEDLDLQIARLSTMSVAERQQIPGLDPRRADIILAGAMLVSIALASIGASHIDVSARGLRWGVLYDRFSALIELPVENQPNAAGETKT